MKSNLELNPLLHSTQARLGYCALAAAGVAYAPNQADATILTFTPNLVLPQTVAGVYINFLTGATGTSGGAVAGWDFNPYNSNGATQLGFYWPQTLTSGAVGAAGQYTDITSGTTISGASAFIQSINSTLNFQTAGDHVLGFRFLNEGTGQVNYGYATLRIGNSATDPGFPATLLSYSFENSGGAITYNVAAVPEPGTAVAGILALATGAASVRRWRRRPTPTPAV